VAYGLFDLKVAKCTDATANPETYNSFVDVPGIRKLNVKLNINPLEKVRGDNTDLATISGEVSSATFSTENAALELASLDEIMPGATSSSGTSRKVFDLMTSETPFYFKLKGKAKIADGGTILVTLWKCRMGDLGFELSDGKAIFPTFGGEAVENLAHKVVTIDWYDTDETIS
jgi:hypothetical protein